MKRILDKKLLRYCDILECLTHNEWTTVNQISEQKKIPEITIRKDLSAINELIHPLEIERSSKFGIRLSRDTSKNMLYIYKILYKTSLGFTLIEHIFQQEYISIGKLAEHLFISESSLKREMKRINRILQEYDIQINAYRLDFVGNEKKIRWFLFSFLFEKYEFIDPLLSPPQSHLLHSLVQQIIQSLPDFAKKNMDYATLNKLKFKLFIELKRGKNSIKEEKPLKNYLKLTSTFSITLLRAFNLYYSANELTALLNDFSKRMIQQEICRMEISHASYSDHRLDVFTGILHTIETKSSLTIPNKARILSSLYITSTTVYGPTKILYHPSVEFFYSLHDYLLPIVQLIQTILLNEEQLPLVCQYVDASVIDTLTFIILTQWENLSATLSSRLPHLNAALIGNTPFEHLQLLKHDIEYHFNSRLRITIPSAQTIEQLVQNHVYDFIITNISDLPIKGLPIVSVHSSLFPADYLKIFTVYSQLLKNEHSIEPLVLPQIKLIEY